MSDIIVVRTFARKRNSTITTNSAPSYSECSTLVIELSMNLDWRKASVLTCTSAGKFFSKSFKASSKRSVSSMVPVPGCLVTVSRTAGFPFSDARPKRGSCAPTCTSATFPRVTASPLTVFTTTSAICLTSSVDTTPRTMYSLPYS